MSLEFWGDIWAGDINIEIFSKERKVKRMGEIKKEVSVDRKEPV